MIGGSGPLDAAGKALAWTVGGILGAIFAFALGYWLLGEFVGWLIVCTSTLVC